MSLAYDGWVGDVLGILICGVGVGFCEIFHPFHSDLLNADVHVVFQLVVPSTSSVGVHGHHLKMDMEMTQPVGIEARKSQQSAQSSHLLSELRPSEWTNKPRCSL